MRGSTRGFLGAVYLLVVMATAFNLLLVGSAIALYRLPSLAHDGRQAARSTADALEARLEALFGSIQARLELLAATAPLLSENVQEDQMSEFVGDGSAVRAVYMLDSKGRVLRAQAAAKDERLSELRGADFSYTPLYRAVSETWTPVWSDKFISVFSGDTAVGVGLPCGDGVIIAELSLGSVLDTVRLASSEGLDAPAWIVDRKGELVADTEGLIGPGEANLLGEPFVRYALEGGVATETARIGDTLAHLAATRSEKLGWTVIARAPAGIRDQHFQAMALDIIAMGAGAIAFGLLIGAGWAKSVGGNVRGLVELSSAVSEGRDPGEPFRGVIREFDAVADELRALGKAVDERERSLRSLNEELEDRVAARTAELEGALERLTSTQDELVRSQKLAALGNLVAGIAHELNTPLGNGMMAVSTIADHHREFAKEIEGGLRKSALDSYVSETGAGIGIALRNLRRAAELIGDFKQLAVDRASDVRRPYFIDAVVRENLAALYPALKRTPYTVETAVEPGIAMDGYPGLLGQVIVNLVNNAVTHGFSGRDRGVVRISGARAGEKVRLSVSDDGVGIPDEAKPRVFEPFFTTRMGSGGSGLGLYIVHNAIVNALGGSVSLESEPGKGTTFTLELPLVAPERKG